MARNKLPPHDIQFVRNILRQGSIKWKGRAECLRQARIKKVEGMTKKGTPILKSYWKCAMCEKYFRNISDVEVDHIEEIGPFNGDWNDYINRHFPPVELLQCLCVVCHLKKTQVFNSARLRWKRKK